MNHGPNHDFAGLIPLALHHTPLQQAIAALVAIQRARLAEGAQPLVKPQHTFTNCRRA